jgi:hypothetical protein
MAHQTATPSRPRANLRFARGSDATRQTSTPLEDPAPLEWISASLEGSVPLEQISASLEASPRPTAPHLLPLTGALNALTRRGRPDQKENPRHVDLLTPPGSPTPALCEEPTIVRPSPALCRCCAGWPVSFLNTVLPTHVLPTRRAPRKGMATPSRSVRSPTQHSPMTVP